MILASPAILSRQLPRYLRLVSGFGQLSSTSTRHGRRCFAESSKLLQEEDGDVHASSDLPRPSKPKPSRCWTIISNSAPAVISTIAKTRLRKQAIIAGKAPLILLLVTPSHIELLKNDPAVIARLIGRAFHSYEVGQEFHVVAAVVDRVTYPKPEDSDHSLFSKVSERDGAEGISVCILDSETAAPDLWTTRGLSMGKGTMSGSKQGTLSFLLRPSQESAGAQIKHRSVATRVVQLPVANTIFHNGRASTLLAQRWVITEIPEPINHPEIRLTEEASLPQQVLRMTGIVNDISHQSGYSLQAPVEPITAPRIVDAAMGNIIRSIQMSDRPEDSVPASTELEKAVASVYQTSKLSREIFGVWALVTPREYRDAQTHFRATGIQGLIDSGSRLHKVLSGGGGWGNKQGLLALDPDSEYNKDKEAPRRLFGDGDDVEAEKLEALGQVVRPGDVVSFWVYFAEPIAEKTESNVDDVEASPNSMIVTPPSIVFGTMPSTMDLMPNLEATSGEATLSPSYTVIENHFGMLSEQGMSMKISATGSEDPSALSAEKGGVVVQTKLDVPYSRVSIAEKGETVVHPLQPFRKFMFGPKEHVQNSAAASTFQAHPNRYAGFKEVNSKGKPELY